MNKRFSFNFALLYKAVLQFIVVINISLVKNTKCKLFVGFNIVVVSYWAETTVD